MIHSDAHNILKCNINFQSLMAKGKQHALAIGFTKISAKDM